MNTSSSSLPFVSIVLPCLNENEYISDCLDSIINFDYPKDQFEVIICDGLSDDGTRDQILAYQKKYPCIKMIDNPKKIIPAALNLGIKSAVGEIIFRLDVHSDYPRDYMVKSVSRLIEYKVANVGGVIITKPKTPSYIGKSIVAVLSSPFGVGNSLFRTGSKEPTEVDTVFGGCFHRSLFNEIGFYNEDIKGNEDLELNLRIKAAGGKIMLFPDIVATYYARSSIWAFCKNNFRNGFWAIYTLKFVKYFALKVRHLIPMVFFLSVLISSVLGFLYNQNFLILLAVILFPYLVMNLLSSLKIANNNGVHLLFVLPVLFFVLHMSHGIGAFWGLLKTIFSRQFWEYKFS